jgi:hypothetical protein
MSDPPVTHSTDPYTVRDELDYEDMVALSGMFRRWAVYEARFAPEQRTRMIAWSADLERLASWVGPDWRAANPTLGDTHFLKFLARLERDASGVINLQHAKHWMGLA